MWLGFAVLTAMSVKINAVILGVTLHRLGESYGVVEAVLSAFQRKTVSRAGKRGKRYRDRRLHLVCSPFPTLNFGPIVPHSSKLHSYFLPSFPSYCTLAFLRVYLLP
jgi:hypothetical protein